MANAVYQRTATLLADAQQVISTTLYESDSIDEPPALQLDLLLQSPRIVLHREPSAPVSEALVVSLGECLVKTDLSRFDNEDSRRLYDAIRVRNTGVQAYFMCVTSPMVATFYLRVSACMNACRNVFLPPGPGTTATTTPAPHWTSPARTT